MPIVFTNGTKDANGYPGFTFTTINACLEKIRDTLVSAGWTTINDSITASSKLIIRGESAGHYCYANFTVLNGNIRVRADLLGTEVGGNLSPDLYLDVNVGQTNHLFLSADADAFCVAVRQGVTGIWMHCHLGFLSRPDPANDQYGWMFGRLNVNPVYSYWARSRHSNQNWRSVSHDYSYNFASGTQGMDYASSHYHPMSGIIDRYTVGANTTTLGQNSTNASYQYQNGAFNRLDNKYYLGAYYQLEGCGTLNVVNGAFYTNTGSFNTVTQSIPLYYRGAVKFAVVGLASLGAGQQIEDATGKCYLSAGGFAVQGFRIA